VRSITLHLACGLLLSSAAVAENIDPGNDGSQYAYAENVGWVNAEPGGSGGVGLHVTDSQVTGWMWGENVGWISLSCANTASCGTLPYGVANDEGVLTGHAWGENIGWVSFSCENTASCTTADYGVVIDPFTGEFSGRAWAENVGWVTFASTGAHPYQMKTAWRCTVPAGSTAVGVGKSGQDAELVWSPLPDATRYDVVRGGIATLQGNTGDFAASTEECVTQRLPATFVSYGGTPPVGDGYWFLVRAADCGGGSYDSGVISQIGLRDAEIASSGNDCP